MIVRATAGEFLPATGSIDLLGVVNRQLHGAWSLHWLVGDNPNAQLALLVVMGICSISLAIGFRTPISKILLLLLTLSLHNSNPNIIDTGDLQLVTALLWACLLPVGQTWSVDRLLQPADANPADQGPTQDPDFCWPELG